MEFGLVVSVIVAVVSAVAAVGAAVLARRSATEVVSLTHRVAALDRAAEQLRSDYAAFMGRVGAVKVLHDAGPLLADSEILYANPQCSEALVGAAQKINGTLVQSLVHGATVVDIDAHLEQARAAVQETLAGLAEERLRLLQTQRPWWRLLPG